MAKCPNCSAERTQEYCSNCGQRRIRVDDLSARRFFRELFDEAADLDVTFKTVRTLRWLAIVLNGFANFAAIRLTLALA